MLIQGKTKQNNRGQIFPFPSTCAIREVFILSLGNVGPSVLAPAGPIPQLLCLIALPLAT